MPKRTEVGYKKPPRSTQFKPGTSGNPRGRPKGSVGVAAIIQRVMKKVVPVNENGKRKMISKFEAAVTQLTNKAASGDVNATKQLISLAQMVEEQQAGASAATPQNTRQVDDRVLQNLIKRLNRPTTKEQE